MISLKILIKIFKTDLSSAYHCSPNILGNPALTGSAYLHRGKIEVEMYTAKYIDGD